MHRTRFRRFGGQSILTRNRAAAWDAYQGVISSGGLVSQWSDQSPFGRHLLQATGANQPIHLPFDGNRYGWLPGVAANYFSTPDSAAASITGDIDVRVQAALLDWTPAGNQILVSKWAAAPQSSYRLFIAATTGQPIFRWTLNGTDQRIATGTIAPTVNDGTSTWIRATLRTNNGSGGADVTFFQSQDGATWTQLGGVVTVAGAAGSVYDGTAPVEIGSDTGGTANLLIGKVYRAQIFNGINGTLAVDFDPSRWSSGTTFTGSTGETWTINTSGNKPAQIVNKPSLLFDGAAHFMKAAAFPLTQPETIYLVCKPITWTSSRILFDGNAANSGWVAQVTSSPNLGAYAGTLLGGSSSTAATLGAPAIITAIFNGAKGALLVTGASGIKNQNFGAADMGGFTLAARGDGAAGYANIQVNELLVYAAMHSDAEYAYINGVLRSKWGVL